MDTKDWILLLFPIIANGVILYFIQLYFNQKAKRNEHKNEIKQNINNTFFTMLIESKENFRNLGHCLIDDPGNIELFNQNLFKFNIGIRKTLDYYNDYTFYLKDYSNSVKCFETLYNNYVEFGRNHPILNEESRSKLQEFINELFDLICEIANCYLKEI